MQISEGPGLPTGALSSSYRLLATINSEMLL
jgi:hypothetical protein